MAKTTSNKIAATEENFPGGFEDTELMLCHFMKEECKTYDLLQDPEQLGEPFLDDELEIRSYAPMGNLIKEEGFRDMFLEVASTEDQSPHFPVPLNEYHAEGEERIKSIPWEPAPGDEIPEIKEMAAKGRNGDSVMVLMPTNMVYLFGIARGGEVELNPSTGWPEFGNFFKAIARPFKSNVAKSIVRVGATVAGAMIGGPMGAAAGNAIGGALTGRRSRDLLPTALKAAGYTAMANTGMNMYNGQGSMQAMGNSMGPSNFGSMNPFGGGGQATPFGQVAQQGMQQMAPQAAQQMVPQSAMSSASGQGSWLPSLMKAAPYAIQAASGLLARKGDKENWENKRKADEENYRRQDAANESWRQKMGFYEPLKTNTQQRVVNPQYGQPGEPYYIYEGDTDYDKVRVKRAEGGGVRKGDDERIAEVDSVRSGVLLKGPGNGTSDSIYTKVPEDTFIMNATLVSLIGNGDTVAGAKMIKELLDELVTKHGKSQYDKLVDFYSKNPKVDVALSTGEVPILPAHVALIGDNNVDKGHKRLENLEKKLKKQKFSHKGKIPPNTKKLSSYLGD